MTIVGVKRLAASVILCVTCACVCVSVYLHDNQLAETKINQNWHRDSPSGVLAHQLILGQRSRSQGHKVQKGQLLVLVLYIHVIQGRLDGGD